jgi:hypothetical protein
MAVGANDATLPGMQEQSSIRDSEFNAAWRAGADATAPLMA